MGYPNLKESALTTSRTSRLPSLRPTVLHAQVLPLPSPPFPTLPALVEAFLTGLTLPVTNAPSLDAWSAWRNTLARLETLHAECITHNRPAPWPHPWHAPTMRWLADVAVLEASPLRSGTGLIQRHRLAQGLIALVHDAQQQGQSPTQWGGTMAQHLWWMAEHVDLWVQRDRGPVHTAKRMQSVATLLQRFAGGCLAAWLIPMPELSLAHQTSMGPDLVRAAEQALAMGRIALVNLPVAGHGLPPAVVAGEAQRTWQRRMNPDGVALSEVFAIAWHNAQQRLELLDRALRAPLDPSLFNGRSLNEVLVQAVTEGLRQEQAARDVAQREAEALRAEQPSGSLGEINGRRPAPR